MSCVTQKVISCASHLIQTNKINKINQTNQINQINQINQSVRQSMVATKLSRRPNEYIRDSKVSQTETQEAFNEKENREKMETKTIHTIYKLSMEQSNPWKDGFLACTT